MADAGDPVARVEAAVRTIISSNVHSDRAQMAAQVAWREHGRLVEADQRAVFAKRGRLVALVAGAIHDGVDAGRFTTTDVREAARAIVTLCISVVEHIGKTTRLSMSRLIERHQRFALSLAGHQQDQ